MLCHPIDRVTLFVRRPFRIRFDLNIITHHTGRLRVPHTDDANAKLQCANHHTAHSSDAADKYVSNAVLEAAAPQKREPAAAAHLLRLNLHSKVRGTEHFTKAIAQ